MVVWGVSIDTTVLHSTYYFSPRLHVQCKIVIFFLPIILAYVLGAQKNRLIETVL